MSTINIVSVSGGKDSAATLAVAIVKEVPNLSGVFADTGNEHEATYDYVHYLEEKTGIPIRWIKADFTEQMAGKREFIAIKWREQGIPESVVVRALELLHPTGIPFLDLCMWKGRFPSTMSAFCTIELKRNPIMEQVMMPLMDKGDMILSWQGVRLDESHSRRTRFQGTGACVKAVDEVGGGLFNYRPILRWSVRDVFQAHDLIGIKPNPLYLQDMGRVGCLPCINCGKDELLAISKRFPEHVERVAGWESIVSEVSKRGASTFFPAVTVKNVDALGEINHKTHGIYHVVEWAKTSRGGRQYDMLRTMESDLSCSSVHGLCE